jgi:hypothetical protein
MIFTYPCTSMAKHTRSVNDLQESFQMNGKYWVPQFISQGLKGFSEQRVYIFQVERDPILAIATAQYWGRRVLAQQMSTGMCRGI